MYLILYRIFHKIDKVSIYKPEKYSAMVSICIIYFSRYEVIILSYEVISLITTISQSTG